MFITVYSPQYKNSVSSKPVADPEIYLRWGGPVTRETCSVAQWPSFLTSFNRDRGGGIVCETVQVEISLGTVLYRLSI